MSDDIPKSIVWAHCFAMTFVGLNIAWMFTRKAFTNQAIIPQGRTSQRNS